MFAACLLPRASKTASVDYGAVCCDSSKSVLSAFGEKRPVYCARS